jgi:hypothetical protein
MKNAKKLSKISNNLINRPINENVINMVNTFRRMVVANLDIDVISNNIRTIRNILLNTIGNLYNDAIVNPLFLC